MHQFYPLVKGDPLCPLGFHPQVRWPTRCKRCFRDYKEHGGKKKEEESYFKRSEITTSSPNLSLSAAKSNNWFSSSNASSKDANKDSKVSVSNSGSISWTSTPDLVSLEDSAQANIPTFSLSLPKRKQLPISKTTRTVSDSFSGLIEDDSATAKRTDSRAKKIQAIKEASQEISKRIQIKELNATVDENTNHDVQFLIQVKSKLKQEQNRDDDGIEEDALSTAGTETTDTTLVGNTYDRELQEQIDSLKQDLDAAKAKCEKLEREKSDLLLRRLASIETVTSKTTANEVLKLQKKCNELQTQIEDFRDDKRSLALKVKELEEDLECRPAIQASEKVVDELKSKLLAAETLCEELMDENEDMKKELRNLEEEIEELQDNFREDQANEYSSLKKELEQTTKNCRILSFKLRKTERKTEQLEVEKGETEKKLREVSGGQNAVDRIKILEQELKMANEASVRLQKQLEETVTKLNVLQDTNSKKTVPKLGNIPKHPSLEGKVSRESLTRGGSQDDPAQLLRDLHDSLEREADLREQLKFAEEEAQNLRKKASRIEDDNESLVLQLKKMAAKAKSRKGSPINHTPEQATEKDKGIPEDDPAELKLLLELNDQEVSVLRRKVEELEFENNTQKIKVKELQDKLTSKTNKKSLTVTAKQQDLHNQKIKALEGETNDLRKKLAEKEQEMEKLSTELDRMQRKSAHERENKLTDATESENLDFKQRVRSIEQEAIVLRTKMQALESENEKLLVDNKRLQLLPIAKNVKSDKSGEKYVRKITDLETELEGKNKTIKQLEERLKQDKPKEDGNKEVLDSNRISKDATVEKYKNRSPKKPSEFTSKVQLKNMVKDLENEISEILVVLGNYENAKSKLETEMKEIKTQGNNSDELNKTSKQLEETKLKLNTLEKELQTSLLKHEQDKSKYDDIKNTLTKMKDTAANQTEENKKLYDELNNVKDKEKQLEDHKRKLETEIEELKNRLNAEAATEAEISSHKSQIESLKSDLLKKEKKCSKLKADLDKKEKSLKELNDTVKRLEEVELLLNNSENKFKKSEEQRKEEMKQMSTKLEEEREKLKKKESEHTDLYTKWMSDQKTFKLQTEKLTSKIKDLESVVKQFEESTKKENSTAVKLSTSNKEINALKDELRKTRTSLNEVESKLDTANANEKDALERLAKLEKEKRILDEKVLETNTELQNERKKIDDMKLNYESENKKKKAEVATLKSKIKKLELNSSSEIKKVSDDKQEFQDKLDKLENSVATEKQLYENLTAKYEVLEEEYIVTKAKLVMEKETVSNQLAATKRELEAAQYKLNELNTSFSDKKTKMLNENYQLEEKIKVLERSNQRGKENIGLERGRLKTLLEEKVLETEQFKKEKDVLTDQLENIRKEYDDLKKKLDDYDRVSKIQRSINADTTIMEKEINQLRSRLVSVEASRKSDLAECKLRYDSQLNVLTEEMHSIQLQLTRFKRERDTYKHMLEGAQQTIGDLKHSSAAGKQHKNLSSFDEEEHRTKVATLEQQISCMEDELSEARLEASKLKTELVSERSSWEIKLSELHSRVNELEEERILTSGRTKIPGLKTRMELAWQKEREEQQRLLQETSTLARDLRQTLFEVERERDKERLDSKRKQEQLKKTSEEDQEENRRKLTELQCDLLELRDAHAKLRTTNEKLRRERERNEKEREEFKTIISGKKRLEHEEDKRINSLLEQIETLVRLTEVTPEKDVYTPTPPRRVKGSKSRESSPAFERSEPLTKQENRKLQLQSAISRLNDVTTELRRYRQLTENDRERERIKRTMGLRRATSTEYDNIKPETKTPTFSKKDNSNGNLHRRSLSLEHTLQNAQSIWRDDNDSLSSLQSIEGVPNLDNRWGKRDASLDSRLSSGSTQSESGTSESKKKSFIGKLKKLTKSRSIDDKDPGHFSSLGTLPSKNFGSDTNEEKSSKKDLRERITGIFKKGSSSRSNSLERHQTDKRDNSSTQRPLMPNGSDSNLSSSPVEAKTFALHRQ